MATIFGALIMTTTEVNLSVTDQLSTLDKQPITFEYGKNPALLKQYYNLREYCYRFDLKIDSFPGKPDEYDETGITILVLHGNRVIGGSRLNISTPLKRAKLPLEENNFIMRDIFPELALDNKSYCEFSRFAIHPEYRNRTVCADLMRALISTAQELGCSYQFSVSTLVAARNYRMLCNTMNIRHVIRRDIIVPVKTIYENLNKKGIYIAITELQDNILQKNISN